MRSRRSHSSEFTIEMGSAQAKFCAQALPFVQQLSLALADAAMEPGARNFGSVKTITPAPRFPGDAVQKSGDGVKGAVVSAKSSELRMASVAASGARKDLLRQQRFAPR